MTKNSLTYHVDPKGKGLDTLAIITVSLVLFFVISYKAYKKYIKNKKLSKGKSKKKK
tara:strand:- start:312 stop:482 length:171 start_codon:yes stop_codon:yes gene_type:complete